MLYDAVEQIAQTSCRAQIFTAIENPGNSHYWVTTPMQNLVEEFGDKYVSFHNCRHGGERDKLTSVWVLSDWLDSLNARCDGSHPHKSWKVTVSGNMCPFPRLMRRHTRLCCVSVSSIASNTKCLRMVPSNQTTWNNNYSSQTPMQLAALPSVHCPEESK